MSIKITFKVYTLVNTSIALIQGRQLNSRHWQVTTWETVDIGSDKDLTPVRGHSTNLTNPDLMC